MVLVAGYFPQQETLELMRTTSNFGMIMGVHRSPCAKAMAFRANLMSVHGHVNST